MGLYGGFWRRLLPVWLLLVCELWKIGLNGKISVMLKGQFIIFLWCPKVSLFRHIQEVGFANFLCVDIGSACGSIFRRPKTKKPKKSRLSEIPSVPFGSIKE